VCSNRDCPLCLLHKHHVELASSGLPESHGRFHYTTRLFASSFSAHGFDRQLNGSPKEKFPNPPSFRFRFTVTLMQPLKQRRLTSGRSRWRFAVTFHKMRQVQSNFAVLGRPAEATIPKLEGERFFQTEPALVERPPGTEAFLSRFPPSCCSSSLKLSSFRSVRAQAAALPLVMPPSKPASKSMQIRSASPPVEAERHSRAGPIPLPAKLSRPLQIGHP